MNIVENICCNNSWFEGAPASLIGVIVGFLLSLLPNYITTRRKIKSYKDSLKSEVEKCKELAENYISEGEIDRSYKFPVKAWNNAMPELLALGVLSEQQTTILNNIYIEIEALNNGLDIIAKARLTLGSGSEENITQNKNRENARKISAQSENALTSIKSIK